MEAIRSVVAGLMAARHHTEASLWFGGSALYIVAAALVGAGLLVILIAGISSAPHAAHDLGHLVRVPVPLFAGFAGLGALLMVPLLLGEGPLGLTLALLCVGMLYGSNARRLALALAAAALFCGLYPVPRLAAVALSAFPADPVARAAYTTASGLASPVDLARLERAAETDALALRGLAIHARQMGNLGSADALYQRLLENDPTNLELINNAANVRLDLGHVRSALELYDRAAGLADSAVVLFNLSQAYGRAFQVDELNRVLEEAQRVDSELLVHFTRLQRTRNENFLVDLPLSARLMWRRAAEAGGGDALAAEFRAGLAPGWLGASADHAAALLAALVGAVWLLSLRFEPSDWCARCGTRKCSRCGHADGSDGLCNSCTRLFFQPEKTDRALRTERVEALRERARRMRRLATVGSVLIPGAAGFLVQRPLRGLLGAFCFTLAAAAVVWRGGVVPDPLVAGAAGPIAFLGVASIAGLLYLGLVAAGVASLREDSS
jgi:tetratricopeptide (TPR) repeat protein